MKWIAALCGVAAIMLWHSPVMAAGTDYRLFITWRGATYVPAWYQGRTLPSSNSPIIASLTLIDKGRVVDLSGQSIYWYVDGNFVDSGRNLQTISFQAPERTGGTINLRAELPDYQGGILRTVVIPISSPRAVIYAPFPNNNLSALPVRLLAFPYFFNVANQSQLNYSWDNGGQKPGVENPWMLWVDGLDSGSSRDIGLRISRPNGNLFESAADSISLFYNQ